MGKQTAPRHAHLAEQTVSLQSRRQIADLCDLASQAVVRPKSLTPEQVQEVGWGLLMLVRKLHSYTLLHSRGLTRDPET